MVKEVNMDTSSTIKRLLGEYEKIRTENQREGQRREQEIRQGFPEIEALLEARRDRLTGSIRAALQGRAVDAEVLQTGMRELNGKIRAELTKAGYPEDYLQPIYLCPICRDTGYVGEPVHELCACMKQRIMDAENAGEHKGGLGRHSFAQFDLNVFPDIPIPGEKRSQRDGQKTGQRDLLFLIDGASSFHKRKAQPARPHAADPAGGAEIRGGFPGQRKAESDFLRRGGAGQDLRCRLHCAAHHGTRLSGAPGDGVQALRNHAQESV